MAKSRESNFMEHSKKIKIEGFQLDRLLNECMIKGIDLRNIRMFGDMELVMKIKESDYDAFLKLVRSRYRITILEDKGYKPFLKRLLANKVMLVGLALFLFLIYYQSIFIAEIRINGYESFTETRVRESLASAGFYEGGRKDVDIGTVKNKVMSDLGNITWMGITYKGSLAEVTIAEGTVNPEPVDFSKPCHVIADKEGYIQEILPKQGLRALEPGAYVRPGDVLISGMVPVTNATYIAGVEEGQVRYVHAEGTVKAHIPYRFTFYQDRYQLIQTKTGNRIFGVEITFGDRSFDTTKLMNSYETSQCHRKTLVSTIRPLPIKVEFLTIDEVTLSKKERSETEILRLAEAQLRTILKEKLPEKPEITNKGLNFVQEKNIIEVSAMIESLQEIGTEQEIMIGNTKSAQ